MKKINKIFGIGLSRTGTTSLYAALNKLGFKTAKFPRILKFPGGEVGINNSLVPKDLEIIDRCQGWVDTPVARFYKILDEKYPNSKFILTTRDIDDWLRSCEAFFVPVSPDSKWVKTFEGNGYNITRQLRYDLYSASSYDEKKFRKAYFQHRKEALEYFKNRRDDLLEFDLCGKDGWEKLCSFLDRPVPNDEFPRLNVNWELHQDEK